MFGFFFMGPHPPRAITDGTISLSLAVPPQEKRKHRNTIDRVGHRYIVETDSYRSLPNEGGVWSCARINTHYHSIGRRICIQRIRR